MSDKIEKLVLRLAEEDFGDEDSYLIKDIHAFDEFDKIEEWLSNTLPKLGFEPDGNRRWWIKVTPDGQHRAKVGISNEPGKVLMVSYSSNAHGTSWYSDEMETVEYGEAVIDKLREWGMLSIRESDDDEDDDAFVIKDVTPVNDQQVEDFLKANGFELEENVFVKRLANMAITVVPMLHRQYAINFYRRGPNGWLCSHRINTTLDNVMDQVSASIREDLEDDEMDFEERGGRDFYMKDVYSGENLQEMYALMEAKILDVSGYVTRRSSRYVHEKTTFCELEGYWFWEQANSEETARQIEISERIDAQIANIQKEIDSEMVKWNRKIYKELEIYYNDSISDEVASENIRANDYQFDEEGNWEEDGGFTYDQLSKQAQQKARERWVELESGEDFFAEPVIKEWKWLLKNKGFGGVEINFSGFWNQGDGASFTCKHIDILRYLNGPDPLEVPEENREQLDEGEDDLDPKDVYGNAPHRSIKHLETKADYDEYETRVAEFFREEGVNSLSPITDDEGNTVEDEFSSRPCDVCHRSLGGRRIHVHGYDPHTKEIKNYLICGDCEYYAIYGQLDDMTMLNLKDDPQDVNERYAGAAKERGIWYHGTSSALIPKILSGGLVPNPKVRSWGEDPHVSAVQPTRKSLPGIYVTTNLMTAVSSAGRVARRDKAQYAIVVMELQPRSMVADEDTINFGLSSIGGYASGSAYHHIWPYFMEVYGDRLKDTEDNYYHKAADKLKLDWVNGVVKSLFYKFGENAPNPELEKRVKELLFNEGYRAMLERNVAYTEGWDLGHYQKNWSHGFGEWGSEPPLPKPEKAENDWLAFSDKLARTMKDAARPIKMQNWTLNTTGRVLMPVGFKGSNRIICIIEQTRAESPEYHTQMIVRYGKPPRKLIDDWNEAIGKLDPEKDIIYQETMTEAESHGDALARTGFWGTQAAGGVFVARSTGRFLIPLRSSSVLEPHTWGVWGGAVEEDEDPKDAAEREMREETGYTGPMQLIPLHVFRKGTFAYRNFLAVVPDEFQPRLNWENEDARWATFGEWPTPLHFGLAALIQNSSSEMQKAASPIRESDDDLGDELRDVLETPPVAPTFEVNSSHGQLTALVDDGVVIAVELYNPAEAEAQSINHILKFDVAEWRKRYPKEDIGAGDSIDILDVGFWLEDGRYEPPAEDWREEMARLRHERQR